jgi:hypothetical protein
VVGGSVEIAEIVGSDVGDAEFETRPSDGPEYLYLIARPQSRNLAV